MFTASDDLFRALSDPTRRALLERLLREGELNVRALTEQSGVSQPAVSKHLGVLRQAGLVLERPTLALNSLETQRAFISVPERLGSPVVWDPNLER